MKGKRKKRVGSVLQSSDHFILTERSVMVVYLLEFLLCIDLPLLPFFLSVKEVLWKDKKEQVTYTDWLRHKIYYCI